MIHGEYYIKLVFTVNLRNCNLKRDSYYSCCLEFEKTYIDDDDEDGYVNEDLDIDDNFYKPYITSMKDLNESCKNK